MNDSNIDGRKKVKEWEGIKPNIYSLIIKDYGSEVPYIEFITALIKDKTNIKIDFIKGLILPPDYSSIMLCIFYYLLLKIFDFDNIYNNLLNIELYIASGEEFCKLDTIYEGLGFIPSKEFNNRVLDKNKFCKNCIDKVLYNYNIKTIDYVVRVNDEDYIEGDKYNLKKDYLKIKSDYEAQQPLYYIPNEFGVFLSQTEYWDNRHIKELQKDKKTSSNSKILGEMYKTIQPM